MTLNFDPSTYLDIFKYGRAIDAQNRMAPVQSADQLGNTLTDAAINLQTIHRQKLMNQLTQGQVAQQNALMQPLVPQGQDQSSSPDMSSLMPSFQPQGGANGNTNPMPSPSGTAPGASMASPTSPVIAAWNNHPDLSQFAPGKPQQPSLNAKPILGSGQSQPNNPEDPYLSIIMNPNESPFRQNLASQAIGRISAETEQRPLEMAKAKAGLTLSASEAQKNFADAAAQAGFSAQDMADAQNGRWQSIAQRYGGVIPQKLGALAQEMIRFQTDAAQRQQQMAQTKSQNAATIQEQQIGRQLSAAKGVADLGLFGKYLHPDVYQTYKNQLGQPSFGSGTSVLTATNPQTKQRIKSIDGGKTWQPM